MKTSTLKTDNTAICGFYGNSIVHGNISIEANDCIERVWEKNKL